MPSYKLDFHSVNAVIHKGKIEKFIAFLIEANVMLYTDRYANNKIRAKYFAELLKHCANKRQIDRTPEKLQW